jgi:hypothetical protein
MQGHGLLGLVILLGALVTINALIHWLVICRALYKRGVRFPTGLLFWRFFRALRIYGEICKARGRPLTMYYVAFILTWFNLLLAFGTAVRALWEQTHPLQ